MLTSGFTYNNKIQFSKVHGEYVEIIVKRVAKIKFGHCEKDIFQIFLRK